MKVNLEGELFVLMLTLFASVCMADSPIGTYLDGAEVDCHVAESKVVSCYEMVYKDADRDLNSIYKQLLVSADKDEREILGNMQRAWINLRDAQCKLVEHYYLGSRFPEKWIMECKAIMTIRRVKELKELGTGITW